MRTAEFRAAGALQRGLLWGTTLLATAAGMVYGYDFGKLIGGPVVGVVLALNAAVFCAIMASALVETLCRRWPRSLRPTRRSPG